MPTPPPTIGEQLAGIKSEAMRAQGMLDDIVANQQSGGFVTSEFEQGPEFEAYDEEAARRAAIRNQRRLFQGEIDATNQVYDQLLNEARIEGQGRIGSQRAIAARGGLLGSDFAGAQKDRVQSFNTDIQRGIQAERAAAIGAIEGTMRASVQQELAAKREARQLGAEEYNDFLAGKAARKENYKNALIQDMLVQGIDIESLSEEELAQYLRPAGLKADDVKAAYLRAKAGQEAAAQESGANDFGFMSTSGGIFRTDPSTGEAMFIPSGGGSASGGGTSSGGGSSDSSTTGTTPFDQARDVISQNPEMTDEQIKAALLEQTDLNVSEINSLIDTRENRALPNFDSVVDTIAEKVFANFDTIEEANAFAEKGEITSGGKKYVLTPEQVESLKNSIEEQRGFWQRLVPGGK
jgi:hypothetical protein